MTENFLLLDFASRNFVILDDSENGKNTKVEMLPAKSQYVPSLMSKIK